MTVVVWDGKTLAADRESGNNYIKCAQAIKVHRIRGYLVGNAGVASVNAEWRNWFEQGADPEKFVGVLRDKDDYSRALVITPAAEIMVYERTPYPIRIEGDRYAIGAGAEAALAVLEVGGDAVQAVKVASKVCQGVGGGFDALTLG